MLCDSKCCASLPGVQDRSDPVWSERATRSQPLSLGPHLEVLGVLQGQSKEALGGLVPEVSGRGVTLGNGAG